jgi:hypothetical protein
MNISGLANEVPAGSAGSPSIYSTGDSNTGVFFPAADTIAFSEGGTEAMRIDSSGNVGVGTTSIAAKLHVVGSSTIGYFVGSGAAYQGLAVQNLYSSASLYGGIFYDFRNELNAAVANMLVDINTDGSSAFSWSTQPAGTRADRRVDRLRIDTVGSLILYSSTAQKATGTTWSNPSDQRLKTNIMDYPKGITELMQVRVREWEYNGKGGTTVGMAGLGVIADEVMTILPNTVDTYDAKLDEADEETTAIKKFDATEITWLLVKAVQEQQAIITALETRIAALEVI